mmetsp:Transcript_28186/g.81209  ORF Transcript_28186/g.81209 Transcript_28186/m.81209 type:complete len:207 (-) Transcript_28186:479-1099(-)
MGSRRLDVLTGWVKEPTRSAGVAGALRQVWWMLWWSSSREEEVMTGDGRARVCVGVVAGCESMLDVVRETAPEDSLVEAMSVWLLTPLSIISATGASLCPSPPAPPLAAVERPITAGETPFKRGVVCRLSWLRPNSRPEAHASHLPGPWGAVLCLAVRLNELMRRKKVECSCSRITCVSAFLTTLPSVMSVSLAWASLALSDATTT